MNPHIPMVQWANAVCQQLVKKNLAAGEVSLEELQEREQNQWNEWLPPHALWLPLPGKNQEQQTVLLLARETPWNEGEILLLQRLAGAYGHAWTALDDRGIWHSGRRYFTRLSKPKIIILLGILVALMLMPVRLSVLAPGELVPVDPFLVRSPLEGVIEKIHVRPNDLVQEGQLLFELDPTTLQSKLEVATKTLTTVEAEYRQAVQQAVWDPKSKA
ncbi:MAG: biotin/lipoyl-binding protein, partial [Magnetococcales bacterium]|nr:biotin/lipoyl-binding protein [Magnetococcales bacterium]